MFQRLLLWFAIFCFWELVCSVGLIDALFLAPPTRIVQVFPSDAMKLAMAAMFTVSAALGGHVIATAIGVPLGTWLATSMIARRTVGETIDGIRSIPFAALLPLFLLMFGFGYMSRLAAAAFVSTWAISTYSEASVRRTSDTRRLILRLSGVSRFHRLKDGLLMPALPGILGGLRTTLSTAFVVVVAHEIIVGSGRGLGQYIYASQLVFDIPRMYAGILLTAACGLAVNVVFDSISRRIVHWPAS